MGFFISWVNVLPFYGPQLAMLGITGNFLPHLFTAFHIIGLIYGSIKYHNNPDNPLLHSINKLSPYVLLILTLLVLLPLARESYYSVLIFSCFGLFSGVAVSRWLSWFSSDFTKNKRNLIFGSALALTYILMSITIIFARWFLSSLALSLALSSIFVFMGGLLISGLSIPSGKKGKINYWAALPMPWLILFALFAYASISLIYDQILTWEVQLSSLPFLLIIPSSFVGFLLVRWISNSNRIYFAIIAFLLVGFGFLLYLFNPTGSIFAITISIIISTGLLCFHLYYWISLVETQDPESAPITISLGVSFELAVFAAIYSTTPYLNIDLNRPGQLTGIAGLIFVLLGLMIIALNAHQVNAGTEKRFPNDLEPDNTLALKGNNPRVSTMSAVLHFHSIKPGVIEYLLIDNFNLTSREVEVAYNLFLGYKNKEIQKKLCITMNTLKYHIKNIYAKLGVHNRDKAIELVYTILNEYEKKPGKMNK